MKSIFHSEVDIMVYLEVEMSSECTFTTEIMTLVFGEGIYTVNLLSDSVEEDKLTIVLRAQTYQHQS